MTRIQQKTTHNDILFNECHCIFFNRTVKLGAGIALATYSAYSYPVITAISIFTGLAGLACYAGYRTLTNNKDNNPYLVELEHTEEMTSIVIVNPSKLDQNSDFLLDDDAKTRIIICYRCTCNC